MYCLDSEPNMYNLYKYQFFFPHACSLLLRIRISHLQVAPINHPFIHHFIYNLLKDVRQFFLGGLLLFLVLFFPMFPPIKDYVFPQLKFHVFVTIIFPPRRSYKFFFLSLPLSCAPRLFFFLLHIFSLLHSSRHEHLYN